jgi:hypothetical protein
MPCPLEADARLTPIRDGIASRSLEGILRAEVYLDPTTMGCAVDSRGGHHAAHGARRGATAMWVLWPLRR